VEKRGADSVPRPQEDEGSSAQESADVKESGARASPLRVWSFSFASCQPLQARRPVPWWAGNPLFSTTPAAAKHPVQR
jgi:hypothetical protein